MSRYFTLLILIAFSFITVNAQKASKIKTVQKAAVHNTSNKTLIKDTLEYNVKTTYAKLNALITNNLVPAEALLSNQTNINEYFFAHPEYNASIIMPNSIETKVTRTEVDWTNGISKWKWQSTLLRFAKNEKSQEVFTDMQTKIINIIRKLPAFDVSDPANKILSFSATQNVTDVSKRDWSLNDELTLDLEFVKPLHQTAKQAMDSVTTLFRPGFATIETAEDAMKKYCNALEGLGFSKDQISEAAAKEINLAADRDIKIAYIMVPIHNHQYLEPTKQKLSPDLREKIRVFAQAMLDAYNRGEKIDVKTFDPRPPAPVYTTAPFIDAQLNGTASSSYSSSLQNSSFSGETERCGVCDGTGWMDQVDYSHTYTGISGNYTTTVTKKVRCTFCNGTGQVPKKPKKKFRW